MQVQQTPSFATFHANDFAAGKRTTVQFGNRFDGKGALYDHEVEILKVVEIGGRRDFVVRSVSMPTLFGLAMLPESQGAADRLNGELLCLEYRHFVSSEAQALDVAQVLRPH